jgi:predicted RNA methylase
MSGEGITPKQEGQKLEKEELTVDQQLAKIDESYDYYSSPYGDNMRGALWTRLAQLPIGTHIVDLNAQGGDLTRFASDFAAPDKVYIVDRDPKYPQRWNPDVVERPEVSVSQQDPFSFEPLEPVDAVMANTMLRFLPPEKKEAQLKHIFGYLKSGGRILWTDPVRIDDQDEFEKTQERRREFLKFLKFTDEGIKKFFEKEKTENHTMSVEEMRDLLEKTGFEAITTDWHEGGFVVLTALKPE